MRHRRHKQLVVYLQCFAIAAPFVAFTTLMLCALANPHGTTERVVTAILKSSPF